MRKSFVLIPVLLFILVSGLLAADKPAYLNTDLSFEQRVDDLVSRMTLEEKISQTVNDAKGIEHLGIRPYNWWNECLHGVARAGLATVFPQAIGMAAMWDQDQMFKVSTVISDEGRAKYHNFQRRGEYGIYQGLTFWTPNINIFRDPRWGRGMETYGEDPYLSGKLAIQFVKGIQGDDDKYLKAVATLKHYVVHSGPEPERHTFDAIANERDFRETYLPHFRMGVIESNAYSVMCAYNRYLGEACCGSDRLMNQILREEYGFEGYIVSDCGAINDIWRRHKIVGTSPEAAAMGIKAGCDLNCGGEYNNLLEAVEKGFVTEEEIDIAVKRLFMARFKLGMFDPDDEVPFADISYDVVDSPEHQKVALETAQKSIVLLQNDKDLLPLSKDIKVAVIGPNANDPEVLLGNYNGIPSNPVTPLAGIQKKLGKENVNYALGCEWAEGLPVFELVPKSALFTTVNGKRVNGLTAEIYDNNAFEGEPVAVQHHDNVHVNWWEETPIEGLDPDNFGVRWTGEIVAPVSGEYYLGGDGYDAFKIKFDGDPLVRYRNVHHAKKAYRKVEMQAGKSYEIQVDFIEHHGYSFMDLIWAVPGIDQEKLALDAVEKSDVAVLCMGLSPRLEGEEMRVKVDGFNGGDRVHIKLPQIQEELIKKITALGKPTVLVMMSGSAVAINWANENVPAILEAWYPGQAAGTAIADVLFGDYNPAGRLPVTFYKSVDQLPDFSEYNLVGQTYRFFQGEPLYEFGYGLSYSTFEYKNLNMPKKIKNGENFTVSVDIKNISKMDGEEVVQLYVKDVEASVRVPVHQLQGFERISLKAGETKKVAFELNPEQLSLWDEHFAQVVEPGDFEISIGGQQPGKGKKNVITKKITVKGEPFYLY